MNTVPLLLVTGFLGSGKTTLINNILEGRAGVPSGRMGVLVNDFGQIPVDAALLERKREGDNEILIHEISGGSIFCSCLKGAFILGLKHFASVRPDLLLVEASGLADPAAFGKVLADHGLAEDFHVAGTVCMADPMRILQLSSVLPAVASQITAADLVVLNKSDLAVEDQIEVAERVIEELNPAVPVQKTTQARADLSSVLAGPSRMLRTDGELTSPSARAAALYFPQKDLDRDEFLEFLNTMLPLVLRIKGFYRFGADVLFIGDNGREVLARKLEEGEEVPDEVDLGITVLTNPVGSGKIDRAWRDFRDARTGQGE